MSRYLYEPLGGGRYAPTGLTRTGWNDHDQHGGPPSALLTHGIEQVPLPAPMRAVRVAVHLLRGIPVEPMVLTTGVERAGKRVAVVDATLSSDDGTPLATARAQMIRTDMVPVPEEARRDPVHLPGPPESHPLATMSPPGTSWSDDSLQRFHLDAVEVRSIEGGWERRGPGAAWIRLDADLVAGEATSPLCRFIAVADMANGVSAALPYGPYLWINPDLTVAVHRRPEGEWVGIDAGASIGTDGIGVVHGTAHDAFGSFAHIIQTQLIQAV